ncbi:hypothetical protein BU15DRAFT_27441, partial [Melanogaster broomeanus]
VASLAVLVWDVLLTFGDEVELIWPMPWKSMFKWIYLYLRYANLAMLMALATAISHLTSGHVPASTCQAWIVCSLIILQVSDVSMVTILGFRVYALFNRSRRLAQFLCLLISCQFAVISFVIADIRSGISFETACILFRFPAKTTIYGAIIPITQTILLGLICFKGSFAVHAGWGRAPLVSLVIRQGLAIYFVML